MEIYHDYVKNNMFPDIYNLHYEKFSDGTAKCIEEEIPFDLPQGWAWTRLGNIFSHNTGKALNSSNTDGELLTYITTSNVYWQRFELANLKSMLFTSEEIEKCTVKKGDLLVCEGGDIGRAAIWNFDYPIRIQNHLHRLRPYDAISVKMFYYIFYLYKQIGIINGNGIGLQGFSSKKLHSLIVPIAPLKEQHLISNKIDILFDAIHCIDEEKDELEQVITNAKSKILDLAIRGKLVPQDPNDEPASVLLERIRAEKEALIKAGKIKRDKKESTIFKGEDNSYYEKIGSEVKNIDDEIPFDIPNSWCWTRLGTLFNHNTGKALNTSNQQGSPYTYITTSNLYWEGFVLEELKEMCFTDDELDKCTVNKGDLLVCEGGDIGRSAIWGYDFPMRIQNHIHRLRPYIELSVEFYYYLMFLYKQTGRINGNGIGMQGLSSNKLHSILVPLPPLQEQKNICDAIQQMLEHLTNIACHIN